jgi:hypothetical protein
MSDQQPIQSAGTAKKVTLGAQIFAAVQIETVAIVSYVLGKIDFWAFIGATVLVAAVFAPVYFMMFLDKIALIKAAK